MPTYHHALVQHLRFRLWIAELNFYINVLRIYNDYLDQQAGVKDAKVIKKIDNFKQTFDVFRKEIDDLKHEMHLAKMTLAANLREADDVIEEKCEMEKYTLLQDQFTSLHKKFEIFKEEFIQFEQELLN